jgi:hypothetical protein
MIAEFRPHKLLDMSLSSFAAHSRHRHYVGQDWSNEVRENDGYVKIYKHLETYLLLTMRVAPCSGGIN